MTTELELAGLPALVDRPAKPTGPSVSLSHGAGGDKSTPGLAALAEGLAALGHLVIRFDLPYRAAGRKSPPRAEVSAPGYFDAFEAATQLHPGDWVVGGKSYGGRVASLCVAEGQPCAGMLFYGYPLHPPGKPESLRVDHWPQIKVPCLFLEGTHDSFCDLSILESHLPALGGGHEVITIAGGDHSLRITESRAPDGVARGEREVIASLAPRISDWLNRLG